MRASLAVLVLVVVAAVMGRAHAAPRFVAGDSRCFELRTYSVAPGKFDALHTRFEEHATKLFKKHGMSVVGFWVPDDKPDTLVYLLAFPSRAAADAAWKSFTADPEWVTAKAESERDGRLTTHVESVFMSATEYSPMK